MVHLAFRYIAVVASSLLIFAVAQAENRAEKRSARQDKKAGQTFTDSHGNVISKEQHAVEEMQNRMQKNAHRAKYDPKTVPKSALKK